MNELGRWITPFKRQVGHWLTDISPLMPMLYHEACNFTMHVTSGSGWTAAASLHWSGALDAAADEPTPTALAPLVWANTNDEFDSIASYNANRTLRFEVPEGTTKVVLEAIVSGHGDCEFMPTSHHWYFNGNKATSNYSASFFGAGTMWGCVDQALQGSEPNEHGTWNYVSRRASAPPIRLSPHP